MYKSLIVKILIALSACCYVMGGNAVASSSDSASGPHIQVTLMSEHRQLKPGLNWLGVLFSPDPEWHTYWRNPGDSGEAPRINWQLPDGMTAGDIQWPIPRPINVAHLVNYGYESDNLLMVPIHLENQQEDYPEHVTISADISWLVCKEDCIPGWATLSKSFPVDNKALPSKDQPLFHQTRTQLPREGILEARHEINHNGLVISVPEVLGTGWKLLPLRSDVVQHNAQQERIATDQDTSFILTKSDYFSAEKEPMFFLLTNAEQGVYVNSKLNVFELNNQVNLLLYAGFALLGGLILNLMPCVLPVLAIKAMSINKATQGLPIKLGYGAGVLVSFNLFALLIVALKSSGQTVGWGFHMQEPLIIALLAFLFTFIALVLLDVAPQGSRLAGIGQGLVSGQSVRSQFFTGVLAVVVASPCTAPFMAAALGVAMVSDTATSLIIFNALAIGFALPLTLIYFIPSLSRMLPKPGQWMVTFRQFLAFPMLATVLWLGWVYLQQTSPIAQLVLFCGLLLFCLAIWLMASIRQLRYMGLVLLLVALGSPFLSDPPNRQKQSLGDSVAFSPATLEQLRKNNQVVLVNMTADWCITCKVNEQVAFQSQDLTQMLNSDKVHYLVGDWTNKNQQILDYLNRYQRSGVPLYVVYSGEAAGQVLPQILTADIVVEALEKAIKETQNAS